MTKPVLLLVTAIAALLGTPAAAQMREITDGAFTDASPDKAYVLYHVLRGKNGLPAQPIFMRVPSDDGTASDEALFAARNGKSFARVGEVRVYLLEVPPGDYLLYGLSLSATAPTLATCFCLGSVSFTARSGVVTDVGAVLVGNARSPSDLPELVTETGFGPSIDTGFYNPVGALRQEPSEVFFPGGRVPRKIERASFRAMGRFFDPRTAFVNRLAPLSGVLSYEGGKPIDAVTKTPVPDHFAQEAQ